MIDPTPIGSGYTAVEMGSGHVCSESFPGDSTVQSGLRAPPLGLASTQNVT